MTLDLRFDEEDWARIRRDYVAWWAHELERPLIQITGWEPQPGVDYQELPRRTAAFPMEMSADEVIAQVGRHLEATRYYGDAFPRWWPDFGPGMLAGFLGSDVNVVPETVWFSPPETLPAKDIHFRYDADNAWWRRVVSLTEAAVEAWEGRVQVCHTDLGGNLDVVASFRTTEGLLTDLYDCPEEVERLAGQVTRLWLRYYDELDAIIRPTCPGTACWSPIWSPGRGYMLQSDLAYMISPAMFERFVVPDLTACCEHLDAGFYHLDGAGQLAHLDLLLSIERLRGVQWVPGAGNPDPEGWPDVLRRIIAAGKLCQLFVSAEGALQIVRELGGRGFMLTINDQMTAAEADAFLRTLAREGT